MISASYCTSLPNDNMPPASCYLSPCLLPFACSTLPPATLSSTSNLLPPCLLLLCLYPSASCHSAYYHNTLLPHSGFYYNLPCRHPAPFHHASYFLPLPPTTLPLLIPATIPLVNCFPSSYFVLSCLLPPSHPASYVLPCLLWPYPCDHLLAPTPATLPPAALSLVPAGLWMV
jgi:hypothetical protein